MNMMMIEEELPRWKKAYARKDGSKKRTRFHHGLIAQEVKEVADAQGVDFAGYQDHKIIGGKDTLTLGYLNLLLL